MDETGKGEEMVRMEPKMETDRKGGEEMVMEMRFGY